MAAARPADAARADLAALRHVPPELVDVLVVDLVDVRLAEEARLAPAGAGRGHPLPARRALVLISLSCQAFSLERNVVVGAGEVGVAAARCACRHELVAAAFAAALAAAAEELDGVGDDLDGLALLAVLRFPLAPFEAAVDRDRPALRQVLRAALRLVAEDGDAEVVRLVAPLTGFVAAPRVDGDAQRADGCAAAGLAELGILRQVPDEDDAVDVCGHGSCSSPTGRPRLLRRVVAVIGGTGRGH